MKTLEISAEQVEIITSLTEEELESLIHDIKSAYHLSNIAVTMGIKPSKLTINFDGRNDISVHIVTKQNGDSE